MCTMKAKYLLALLPVIALSACSNNLGKEITDNEASALMEGIIAKQGETECLTLSYTATTKIEDRKSVAHYKYSCDNYGNEMYFREETETSKTDNYKSSKLIYDWRETKSQTLFYVKTYNGADKKTTIKSYTVSDIGNKSQAYLDEYDKQKSFIEEVSTLFENAILNEKRFTDEYTKETHYHSNGEGNLTTKVTVTHTGDKKDSTIKKVNFNYYYSNNLFSSYKASYATYGGSTKVEEAKVSFNQISVKGPSNWAQYLVK